jgi:hypothetical protein
MNLRRNSWNTNSSLHRGDLRGGPIGIPGTRAGVYFGHERIAAVTTVTMAGRNGGLEWPTSRQSRQRIACVMKTQVDVSKRRASVRRLKEASAVYVFIDEYGVIASLSPASRRARSQSMRLRTSTMIPMYRLNSRGLFLYSWVRYLSPSALPPANAFIRPSCLPYIGRGRDDNQRPGFIPLNPTQGRHDLACPLS